MPSDFYVHRDYLCTHQYPLTKFEKQLYRIHYSQRLNKCAPSNVHSVKISEGCLSKLLKRNSTEYKR